MDATEVVSKLGVTTTEKVRSTITEAPKNARGAELGRRIREDANDDWEKTLRSGGVEARKISNRVTADEIQNLILQIEPGNQRDQMELMLTTFQDYEHGFDTLEKADQDSILTITEEIVDEHDETSFTSDKKKKEFTNKVAKEIGPKVQQRTKELVTSSRLESVSNKYNEALVEQEALEVQVRDKQKTFDAVKAEEDKRKETHDYFQTGEGANQLHLLKTVVDNNPLLENEFQQSYRTYQQLENELSLRRKELVITPTSTVLKAEITRLELTIQNHKNDFSGKFRENYEYYQLKNEQSLAENRYTNAKLTREDAEKDLQTTNDKLAKKKDVVNELKIAKGKVIDDLQHDIDMVIHDAVEDYVDEYISHITEFVENKDEQYENEITAAEVQGLYQKLSERWTRDKLINPRKRGIRTFHKKNIMEDFDTQLDEGPEGLLTKLGYTDPEQQKRLAPYISKAVLRYRIAAMGHPSKVTMERIYNAPWASSIIDQLELNNPAFSKSRKDYESGNFKNLDWLYLLAATVGAVSKMVEEDNQDEKSK
jgi:hypothetical protein